MADYLDAAGSISGDVEKIRKALYGREVRASIAEAIELLDAQDTKRDDATAELEQKVKDLVTLENADKMGFLNIQSTEGSGAYRLIYRFADGTTTVDRVNADPALAGTEIILGTSIYTYAASGWLSYVGEVGGTMGQVNRLNHHMPCGFKRITGTDGVERVMLLDEDEQRIPADRDGDVEQCGILYNTNGTAVRGVRLDKDTKLYFDNLVSRIAALEEALAARKNE